MPRGSVAKPPLSVAWGKMIGCRTPLAQFSEPTRAWFAAAFAEPTPAQAGAWAAIAAGRHALVVAPTGSGKTLSAFLWSIDRLLTTPPPEDRKHRCRVLYVSPLKALAVDVERNLRAPLAGIGHTADRLGVPVPTVDGRRPLGRHPGRGATQAGHVAARHHDHHAGVAVPDADLAGPRGAARGRDGDPRRGARGRRHQARRPPGRSRWSGSTSCWPVPRSGSGCPPPCARSTRWPASSAARRRSRWWRRRPRSAGTSTVVVPVEDMSELGQPIDDDLEGPASTGRAASRSGRTWRSGSSTWSPQHRSTIVFANSRRLAERLTARLNEIAAERAGLDAGRDRRTAGARSWRSPAQSDGAPPGASPGPTTARSARSSAR